MSDCALPCPSALMIITMYQNRIPVTLLGHIDLHIKMSRVDYQKLNSNRLGELSAEIPQKVENALLVQRERFTESASIVCNADMRIAEVRKFCKLDESSESLMCSAMSRMNLSARADHRILKLARTIADLGGSETIQPPHLAEALQYGPKLMVG